MYSREIKVVCREQSTNNTKILLYNSFVFRRVEKNEQPNVIGKRSICSVCVTFLLDLPDDADRLKKTHFKKRITLEK